MGRGKDDPHLHSDLREKGEQLPVIAFDFGVVKTTSASGETEQKSATTLIAGVTESQQRWLWQTR